MKHGISKNTDMAASNGMSDFEIMATPSTHLNPLSVNDEYTRAEKLSEIR